MDRTARGTVEMSVAMAISGTIGWFVLASGRPVMDVVFWRCVFGGATLLAVCAALGLLRGITRRVLFYATLGGVAIVINWLLLFGAYGRASISIATTVYNTQPFMLVGLGALFFGERLTAQKLAWLAIAFLGVLLVVGADPGAGYGGPGYLVGVLMALGAAFCYAVAAAATKKLAGTPPHLIALIQVVVGMAMLAPFAHLSHLPADRWGWAMVAVVGVVHTGLVYILLYGAIQKLPTHRIGALSFIYPVVAIATDFLAFGHRLHPGQIVGAAAILLAAAGTTLGWQLWPHRRPSERPQAAGC